MKGRCPDENGVPAASVRPTMLHPSAIGLEHPSPFPGHIHAAISHILRIDPRELRPGKLRVAARLRSVRSLERDASEHAVRALMLGAVWCEVDQVRSACEDSLAEMARAGKRGAVEALCLLYTRHGLERAGGFAASRDGAPANPYQRALFLCLSGRWASYAASDPGAAVLASGRLGEPAPVRRRIALAAVEASSLPWSERLLLDLENARPGKAGREQQSQLPLPEEIRAAANILRHHGELEKLWQLARSTPAFYAYEALQLLVESGWVAGTSANDAARRSLLARVRDATLPAPLLRPTRYQLDAPAQLYRLAFSPSGEQLAGLGDDGRIYVWNVAGRKMIQRSDLLPTPLPSELAFGPGENAVLSAASDCAPRLWRFGDSSRLTSVELAGGGNRGIVVSERLGLAFFADAMGTLTGIDVGRERPLWRVSPTGTTLDFAVDDEHCRLVSIEQLSSTICVRDLWTGRVLSKLQAPAEAKLSSLVILPDGDTLVSGGDCVRAWSLGSRLMLAAFNGFLKIPPELRCRVGEDEDGRLDDERMVLIYGARRGNASTGGEYVSFAGYERNLETPQLRVWSPPHVQPVLTYVSGSPFSVAAFSTTLGALLVSTPGCVDVLRLPSFERLTSLPAVERHYGDVLSGDGAVLAQCGERGVVIWDFRLGRILGAAPGALDSETWQWARKAAADPDRDLSERAWLAFTAELNAWQRDG